MRKYHFKYIFKGFIIFVITISSCKCKIRFPEESYPEWNRCKILLPKDIHTGKIVVLPDKISRDSISEEFETFKLLKRNNDFSYGYPFPIYIKYNQPINGYDVYITWEARSEMGWYFPYGNQALLTFVNDTSYFFVLNESFYINNFDEIMTRTYGAIGETCGFYPDLQQLIFYMDYNKNPNPKDSLDYDAPFFFSDIDFDGKQELVITSSKTGQRGTNEYKIYKYESYSYWQMTKRPYTLFDGFTRFDYEHKKVIFESHGGADFYYEDIYKYCDDPHTWYHLIFEKQLHYNYYTDSMELVEPPIFE